jgi:hypothetical protein
LTILLWLTTSDDPLVSSPFLSIVFLLYLVGQFHCLEKLEYSEKTIVMSQFTEKMYHIKLYRVHLAMSGIQDHRVSSDRHWVHMYPEIQLPIDNDNNGQLVHINGHMIWNVYLTGWYGSYERVHVIIKHEHYNTIYALTFLLRWESQKSTERSEYHKLCVPYKQPLTLLILLWYFFWRMEYCVVNWAFNIKLL